MRVEPNENRGPADADRPAYVVSLRLEHLDGALPQSAVHANVFS